MSRTLRALSRPGSGWPGRCRAALALGLLAACAPAPEPVAFEGQRSIDPEVVELVQRKLAAARAAPGEARLHGELGLAYFANELWDLGARSFANAALLDPDDPWWVCYRARAEREAGRGELALELLAGLAARHPELAAIQHRHGQWQLDLGALELAAPALERALALAPEHPDALASVARLRSEQGRHEEALALAQKALQRDPPNRMAHYTAGLALRALGRTAEAERELAAGLGAQVRYLADPHNKELAAASVNYVAQMNEATQAMGLGQYAQALPLLERVAQKRPDDVIVLNNIGACLIELARPAEALVVLERARTLAPQEFGAYLNLSHVCLQLGRNEEALQHADRAVELAPQLGRAHLVRGRSLRALGRLEPAHGELREAARLEPGNAQVFQSLAELALAQKRLPEARGWCSRVVELRPDDIEARANLVQLTMEIGDRAGARALLPELQRRAPNHPRVRHLTRELQKAP